MQDILAKFGKSFITSVRDASIDALRDKVNGESKAPAVKKWIARFSEEDRKAMLEIVSLAVDQTLFQALFFFESNEEFRISTSIAGSIIDIGSISDGLSGELFSTNGWISKFSSSQASKVLK